MTPISTATQIADSAGDTTSVDRLGLFTDILEWLDGVRLPCLEERLVPGTSTTERRRLAALGGLVRSVVRPQLASSPLPDGLRAWIDGAPRPPSNLANRFAAAIRSDGAGFLARIYEQLVGSSNRRRLGTYFTPQTTVDWMLAEWSAKEPRPEVVVDVGAGVGVFTASALRAWRPRLVCAVDVNPVTLGLLTALCIATERPPVLRIILEDYIHWPGNPEQTGPCVTVGNPPYTRLQLLPKSVRRRLRATVPDCGNRAGLSTWMLARAFARLREQDGLLLLLPHNWMEADYAATLRAQLWNAANRRVELTCLSGDLFGDARVDAVALLVGTQRPKPQPFVLRERPDAAGSVFMERSGAPPSFVAQKAVTVSTVASARSSSPVLRETASPLSVFATVRRGVATGGNGFFTLSHDAARAAKLPPKSMHPLVRRLRDFERDTVAESDLAALDSHVRRWLLLVRESQVDRGVAVRAYVRYGEEIGLDDRHLCRQRSPWYDLHCDTKFPDVIVGAMSNGRFRFVENQARAAITNNLFGLTWMATTTGEEQTLVLAWLRSEDGQRSLRAACRVQAGGLRKLEPRALASVSVPITR